MERDAARCWRRSRSPTARPAGRRRTSARRSRSRPTRSTSRPTSRAPAASRSASAPSTAPASTGRRCTRSPSSDGGNGVYRYGASRGFPTDTWNGTNYWVDAVFHPSIPPDTRAAARRRPRPAANATGVAANDEGQGHVRRGARPADGHHRLVRARRRRQRRARLRRLRRADQDRHADADGAARARQDLHGARSSRGNAGPADVAGNRFAADITWNFATAPQCPCTLFADAAQPDGDAVQDQPLELGVRFRPTEDGFITGLRFYKQANNTGTHVGHLWTATGQLLATATYTERDRRGLAAGRPAEPDPGHQGHDLRLVLLLAGRLLRLDAGGFNNAISRAPLIGLANSDGGNGVYKYGASGVPDRQLGRDQLLGRRRLRPDDPAGHDRPDVGRRWPRRTTPSTSPHHGGRGGVRRAGLRREHHRLDVHAQGPRAAPVAATAELRRADAHGQAHADRAAGVRDEVHGDAQERRQRRQGRRRQPDGGRQDLVVHRRRQVPGRRPGRPDPAGQLRVRSVRHATTPRSSAARA